MDRIELESIVAGGESSQLEFKKSWSDLRGGMETLCAFLNGQGGRVLFGIGSSGKVVGQTMSDSTLREIAAEIARIEPAAPIVQDRIRISDVQAVLSLETSDCSRAPYQYHGRAFQRIGSTTSLMPQAEFERRVPVAAPERDGGWCSKPTLRR